MLKIPNVDSHSIVLADARGLDRNCEAELQYREEVEGFIIDRRLKQVRDDAISVVRLGEVYVVEVSVSDVAAHVEKESDIDIAARKQVKAIYTGNPAHHIYSPDLIQNRLTLKPKSRDNLTTTIRVILNPDLTIEAVHLFPSRVKVKGHYSFADVYDIFADREHKHHACFDDMRRLAVRLREKRIQNGSEETYIRPRNRHEHCLIVEECLILANEAAGKILQEQNVSALFRRHTRDGALRGIETVRRALSNMRRAPDIIDKLRCIHAERAGQMLLSAEPRTHEGIGGLHGDHAIFGLKKG